MPGAARARILTAVFPCGIWPTFDVHEDLDDLNKELCVAFLHEEEMTTITNL